MTEPKVDATYVGPLSSSDGVLMAGVSRRLFGHPQTLFDWLDTMAWDGDSTRNSFDAVSYGLERLVHAGLIRLGHDKTGRLLIAPTAAGTSLPKRVRHGRVYRGQIADHITEEFAKSVYFRLTSRLADFPISMRRSGTTC
ncbi:MAG: hypothetical protein ABI725_05975 [Chloroflexota bacterium]